MKDMTQSSSQMQAGVESKISSKLFVGCQITSEVRMHLNQSIQWKHAGIISTNSGVRLQQVHFHGKDYFGFYVADQMISLFALKELQQKIRQELKGYCPDLETETISVCVFPQVFVA